MKKKGRSDWISVWIVIFNRFWIIIQAFVPLRGNGSINSSVDKGKAGSPSPLPQTSRQYINCTKCVNMFSLF